MFKFSEPQRYFRIFGNVAQRRRNYRAASFRCIAKRNEMNDLLEKQRSQGLTPDEEQQWQQYEYLEHLVRIAKSNALLKLKSTT